MNRFDVVALGELLIDFTPSGEHVCGTPLFAANPGGAPANVLALHAKLGGKTAFIGKVGQDAFAALLRRTLVDSGIDDAGLVTDAHTPTTLAFVHLDSTGDRSFSFYRNPGADLMLTADEVRRDLIDDCAIFHFGAVSLTGDPCRTATFSAAEYAKSRGKLISFDPNYRPLLWESERLAATQMQRGVALADFVKVSEKELELLTGHTDAARGAAALLASGPSLVLVSMGRGGAFFHNHASFGHLPAYAVDTVDTTGAGDAFVGAMHFGIRGMTAARLATMPQAELAQAVRFACAAGSLTTAKAGAIPALPTQAEILNCVAHCATAEGGIHA